MSVSDIQAVQFENFLKASAVVDYGSPAVQALAASLLGATAEETAKRCFEWVRDNIEHSIDFRREEVTCSASDALAVGTGLCTAKSHLLVALLRYHGIPAGFCYQRLTFVDPATPFCTHGLVAVWLQDHGWYRCDARGNSKPGIRCEFTPGKENLAYQVQDPGEYMFPHIYAAPWPELVTKMRELASISGYCKTPIDVHPPELPDDQVIRLAAN
ncbi:transglutaminase family protein [Pseudoduganella sp. LjRoot289]|uniref:transglutaminase-like domain-containing protein n=1 Tax=Pseudoduganella sp. LjRoot289 TaxID=3342314 RepID=UPI003ECD664D